jgi:cation diffusion facilitator family transporter
VTDQATSTSSGGRIAIIAALIANLGIAVAKFLAWSVTGSSALLSECVHSLADSGNELLLIAGGQRSKRQPDANHEFGYAATRYVYAFVVSIVLFVFGGAFALYEGWHKVSHPTAVTDVGWGLGVLVVAIGLESWSLRTALHESRHARAGRSFRSYLHRARHPELPVVLLEDLGALTGLVIALSGLSLAAATGDSRWDGASSLLIGLLLVGIAIWLALRMGSLLVGESVLPEQRQAVLAALTREPAVRGVIHLRTLHLGPDEVLVAAKIDVDPDLPAGDLAVAIDAAERRLREVLPSARYVFIEPDQTR